MSRYDEAVLAWAAHLRSGGTTPWSEFWPTAPAGGSGEPPGAVQLELVRRLARAWEGPGFDRLADRVLHRDPPGRGIARLPLLHPDLAGRVGAPAVDPSTVPVRELLRLGTGVLADLAIALPVRRHGRRRTSRRSWVALGAPISRQALATTATGLGRKDVVVCAPSLETILTEVWSTGVQRGAGVRWGRFVQGWAGRGVLPGSAEVARLAETAAHRVGASRVHVFVGAAADVTARAGDPAPLSVESVDLLRRVNRVLRVRVAEPHRDAVRASAVHLLGGAPMSPLAVPERCASWARDHAERIAEALAAGGYAVHGDLEEFVVGPDAPRHPKQHAVLDRLVDVVVRTVREERR